MGPSPRKSADSGARPSECWRPVIRAPRALPTVASHVPTRYVVRGAKAKSPSLCLSVCVSVGQSIDRSIDRPNSQSMGSTKDPYCMVWFGLFYEMRVVDQ